MQPQPIIPIQTYKQQLVLQISSPLNQPKILEYLKIISSVLQVDKQLDPSQLRKTIKFDQENKKINIQFECVELKLLRSCILGFFKHMQLVAKTIEAFKDEE